MTNNKNNLAQTRKAKDSPQILPLTLSAPFYFKGGVMKTFQIFISLIAMILLIIFCQSFGHTADIPDDLAVKAIMGEASNQGYKGMLAVAGAIHNRGTLKGVYGVKARHIYKEPQWVWAMAKKAWLESATNDITNGATHWENIKAFGKPYWVKSMVKVFEYKDHIFYKESK
jgi:hypothetical protein